MKKLFKLFTLAIVLFSTALLTGCTNQFIAGLRPFAISSSIYWSDSVPHLK